MPKGKKGKKGKKDKKGKKNEAKDESITKMAERNSNIWEAKLRMSEFQKEHFRETARQLVEENSSLLDYLNQNEKDTIDVVGYLRKVDSDKENEIAELKEELRNINSVHQADKDALISDFTAKVTDLQDMLERKTNEYDIVMNELDQLKDFRKRKIQMQKELDEIKEAMVQNEKEHKEQTARIEQKFFEEKMRLQIEANKKIEELAEKAHDAAIKNLNDITRNVYKENVQLTESYRINTAEIEKLRKLNQNLVFENDKLKAQNSDIISVVKEKIDSNTKQSKQIKELQSKIEILEKSLSQVVKEFETERENVINRCKIETESSAIELVKMKRALELKSKEMNKVKKLAKNILEQRSDIERFFLDALDYVKQQIAVNRNEYRKEANQMYNSRMLAAYNGQMEYPKVKTFSKKFAANSTNNVFNDLEQAVKWQEVDKLFDLNDLTWEQKEQVLRELFARMNGLKAKKPKSNSTELKAVELDETINDADSNEDDNDLKYIDRPDAKKQFNNSDENFTFITEANYQASRSNESNVLKLPSIVSLN